MTLQQRISALITAIGTDIKTLFTVVRSEGVVVPSDDAMYLGEPTTDGSWRLVRSGDSLQLQRRESGTWVAKGAFHP